MIQKANLEKAIEIYKYMKADFQKMKYQIIKDI